MKFLESLSQLVKDAICAFVTESDDYRVAMSKSKNGLNIFGIKAFNMADIKSNYPEVHYFISLLTENGINVSYMRDSDDTRYDTGILYIGQSNKQTESDVKKLLGM